MSTARSAQRFSSAAATAVVIGLVALGAAVLSSKAHASPQLSFTTFSAGAFTADGSPSTQAGAHPFELTSAFSVGTAFDSSAGTEVPVAAIKDTVFDLPPGVIGDPSATPKCREGDILSAGAPCPSDTQVGYADIDTTFFNRAVQRVPVYNMVPPAGIAAQFRFVVVVAQGHVDVNVRGSGDYGVTATVHGINAGAPIYGVSFHLWGVPADSAHDEVRGGPSGLPRKPFLRNPTSCSGPMTTTLRATSWQEPDEIVTDSAPAPATTGCDHVPFAPTLDLTPDSKRAGSPAGLGIDLNLPQNENPDGLATADLKRAVVTLPAGVAINPGGADGLEGCTDAQFGLHVEGEESCPNGSVIGTTKVTTPLLPDPLEGSAYLAAPLEQSAGAAAAGRMFRVFLELQGHGVRVKLAGSVVPDPVTGQLVATFDNNPQLPFSNFHMDFIGGPRAPLSLPKACGAYTTHSELTSWASETPVLSDSSFTIDQGCDQAGRFEPTVDAGLTNPAAGVFSPFLMNLSRPDGQQDVSTISLSLPPGLTGKLAGIPLCPEPQAAAGTCDAASQIGKVIAAAGAGPNPLYVPQAGRTPTAVYLAGPYHGAPFSLSFVVPAEAGPFNLGTVVVRAALFVDPHDAHVSVVSDQIPSILDGVPLNVQKINVTLDRPGFILAPTSCAQKQIAGTATSTQGATAPLSSPFRVGECANLKFKPKFTVSTSGQASRANGASLTTRLVYPGAAAGAVTLARVRVQLPRQLPSRLTTLQQACVAAVFERDPTACPAASAVGHATVNTPLLPVPLTGNAYFVSHGGAAFPDLTLVLKGYGVTIDLVGTTFISSSGITTTTFKTTPDVPFTTFELTLPEGRFSAVGANLPHGGYSFCGQKLVMPTEFVAQNGAVIHQNTPIVTSGCAKAAKRARKAARGRGHR